MFRRTRIAIFFSALFFACALITVAQPLTPPIIQWEKSFEGIGLDESYPMQLTSDGGCVLAGVSPSTDGDVTGNRGGNDFRVLIVDSTGTLPWQKSLGENGDETGEKKIDAEYFAVFT